MVAAPASTRVARPLRARLGDQDGAAAVVQTALIMPLLVIALGSLLHMGLYMQSRAVTIEAVQQGLTAAAARDGTTTQGTTITTGFLDRHAPVDVLDVTAVDTGTRVTVTAVVRAPGLVPGLPRTITVTHAATKERWVS